MLVNECDPKYSKWQGDQVCWQAMEKINKIGGNKLDHDYKSSVRCGAMTNLLEDFHTIFKQEHPGETYTTENFFNDYIANGKRTMEIMETCKVLGPYKPTERGRTVRELLDNCMEFYNSIKDLPECQNITFDDCYFDICAHLICETYNGVSIESDIYERLRLLQEQGKPFNGKPIKKFRYSSSYEDRYMGIDILVQHEDDSHTLLQIKPSTLFCEPYNQVNAESMRKDREFFFEKEVKGREKFMDADYLYLIYKKPNRKANYYHWCKKMFHLHEMIREDGSLKFDFNKAERTHMIEYGNPREMKMY